MAIRGTGLSFAPLYWVHHDNVKWFPPGRDPPEHHHWGHVHFFMLGVKPQPGQQDVFSGAQRYQFELKDIWGPRSNDPNQSTPYRVVGTPKWFFHVTEVWRRVYIQPWDEEIEIAPGAIVGRKGIKWDASMRDKVFGPFREGREFSPIFIDGARTLPIEYFNTEGRLQTERDNYVKDRWAAGLEPERFDEQNYIAIPGQGFGKGPHLAHDTYPDNVYIWPTIEYQQVTQLNWERPPGWEADHDHTSEDFGDGWAVQVQIPFVNPVTGKYRSPFAPVPGDVRPPGQYFNNLVPVEKQLKNRVRDYSLPNPEDPNSEGGYDYKHRPYGITEEQSGAKTVFFDPYGKNDGLWVQQCLGGMVQAQARVTIEHKGYGPDSRQEIYVNATQYLPTTPFAGKDQLQGEA